jgi:hypothetical protein
MGRNKYFSDPTVPDKESRKKAHYWTDKNKHINFLSKLRLDGLNQSQFHRAMVEGYLADDEDLINYIDKYKETHTVQGKRKRDITSSTRKRAKMVENKFALSSEDIESIFDIIEEGSGL